MACRLISRLPVRRMTPLRPSTIPLTNQILTLGTVNVPQSMNNQSTHPRIVGGRPFTTTSNTNSTTTSTTPPSHYIVNHKDSYANQLSGLHGTQLSLLEHEKDPCVAGSPDSSDDSWFAVVSLSGTQHKVGVGDVLVTDRLKPESTWVVGSHVKLPDEDVLLMGSKGATVVGAPNVQGTNVVLRVEEHTRDAKVVVFKKRRRKSSKRTKGYKAKKTICRVLQVEYTGEV